MIDKYFKRPILWDYVLAVAMASLAFILFRRNNTQIPKDEMILSTVSDLSTVSLTLSGFVLTLLTVLVSFKSTSKPINNVRLNADSVFEIFYSTNLYFETVRHLKNAIISLTLIAVIGYSLKLLLAPAAYFLLFEFTLLELVIVLLTLWRCLLILSKIIALQKQNSNTD